MTFKVLSSQQKRLMTWAHREADKYDGVIADGAIRSGKTVVMITAFIHWAMRRFSNATFAICGKTVASAERNIITPLGDLTDVTAYYSIHYTRSNHMLTVSGNGRVNSFYIFGGKDESSASLIQGITLSGILLDEVALMPESFVNQALARCSVAGSKFWFNCNPDSPEHFFNKKFIKNADDRRLLRLHFTMHDNPALDDDIRRRYESQYEGVFYQRFILGLWVIADGVVYSGFKKERYCADNIEVRGERGEPIGEYYLSCDYGTQNPFSCGLWQVYGGVARRIGEYYYSGRDEGARTDEEHYREIEKLVGERKIRQIVIDPSAASMIAVIYRHAKFPVLHAENDVVAGISTVSTMLKTDKLMFDNACEGAIREFGLYRWDEKKSADLGRDCVIKEHDHAMDDIRYFCQSVLQYKDGFLYREKPKPKRRRAAQDITAEDFKGGWL